MADFSKLLRPAGRVVTVPSLEPDLWLEADYGVGICGARDFDGIGEYFEIDGYTPVGTNDLTLCGWFYSTNNSTHIVFYGGLTNGISIYYLGGSDLRVYYPDGEGSYSTITSGAVNVLPNVWNFFVATVDRDGQLNLYVNDMETPTATDEDISASDGEDWTRSNNAQIGGSGLQYFFEGRICRVGWAVGHVLSQTEREELYNNGNGQVLALLERE